MIDAWSQDRATGKRHTLPPDIERPPGGGPYDCRLATKMTVQHFQMGPDANQDITHLQRAKEMRFISNKGRVVYTAEELPSHVPAPTRLRARARYLWSLLRKQCRGVDLPPLGVTWWRNKEEYEAHVSTLKAAGIEDLV